MKRDLTSFAAWKREELLEIFSLSQRLKNGDLKTHRPLTGGSAALIFEKESLRTRVSFEVGVAQLGGHPIFLQQETIGIATRESVHDIATVLSRYNQILVARTVKHQTLVQLSESATVPVINAMTDIVHPCQILADALTLMELNRFSPETRIVFVGEGNNIANSWLELAEKIPLHLVLAVPSGHEPHPAILEQARSAGVSRIELSHDPGEAVTDADAVYTDVWPSGDMELHMAFKPYQVNAQLLKRAKSDCLVMHRLPARRGEEITREVLDGKQSVVLLQAENRLHVQKAIITRLVQASA